MYFHKAKVLREEFEYTQKYVALYLGRNRSTYANWENSYIIFPLDAVNKLSILYGVSLAYVLGITSIRESNRKKVYIDYSYLKNKLKELKGNNNISYGEISKYIDTNRSTVSRYFNGKITIPTDKLILLCEFFDVEIDELCGLSNK